MPSNINHRKNIIVSRRQKHKEMAVTYKGGACQNCGYNKATTSLCFHHVDPSTKSFSLSKGVLEKDWEAIKSELDKCQLLCQNCHREHHSLERDAEIDLAHKEIIPCALITNSMGLYWGSLSDVQKSEVSTF
jgi:hypothetical protein